jgi:hypothetical protein
VFGTEITKMVEEVEKCHQDLFFEVTLTAKSDRDVVILAIAH